MDKDTHDKELIRIRYKLEKDIRELYYALRKKGVGSADDGIEFDLPLSLNHQDDDVKGVCEQETEDGITSKVCVVTEYDGEETIVDLEQLSVEDLNDIYIELWVLLN